MLILLFLCWVIFNQAFTLEIAIFGIVLSVLVYAFACRFMDYSVKKDLFILKKLPLIISYIFTLIWEIIKANFVLVKLFFTKKSKREPIIVTFESKLRSRTARVLLSNAITLTPGTITTSLEGHKLTVHCYDKSLAAGLDQTVFEKKLSKLEEGFDA